MSSAHPSVHCLVAVARHYGLGASADSLCEEHGIYGDAPTIPQLIAMARGLAMRAQARRLNWRELAKLDGVFSPDRQASGRHGLPDCWRHARV